jgi:hypothetical protein
MPAKPRAPIRPRAPPRNAPKIQKALRQLAKTLVQRGFEDGLTAPDLQLVVLETYLALALERARFPNGRVNASRIELLTGINRKTITSRTRATDVWTQVRYIPWMRRIVLAWRTDPLYREAGGRPKWLPLQGAAPSFESLWRTYGSFSQKRAYLDTLIDLNLVRRQRGGIRLRSRAP